ncbi:MAG: MFS transporter [Lachnospiraceae bacterium]|nr:MFS transporter [Lachnospiraceae bacterium]
MQINSNYIKFFFYTVIYKFGDTINFFTYLWLAYTVTDSAALTGIVAAFNGLPSLVFGLFAGEIADKYDKKKLLIISDITRGIIIIGLIILYLLQSINFLILLISTFIISTMEILSTPARRALPAFLLEKNQILRGNSYLSTGKIIAQLAGMSIAGFVISTFGVHISLIIDSLIFILCTLIIMTMQFESNFAIYKKAKLSVKNILVSFLGTFKEIRQSIIILKTIIAATFVNLFIGPIGLLTLNYCSNILKNGSKGQAILNIAILIGTLIVTVLFAKLKSLDNYWAIIRIGFYLLGISFLLFGFNSLMLIAIFIALIYGIGISLITNPSISIIHTNTSKENMGKMMSIISLVNESSIPIGTFVAGVYLEKYSVTSYFIIAGIFIILFMALFEYSTKFLFKGEKL